MRAGQRGRGVVSVVALVAVIACAVAAASVAAWSAAQAGVADARGRRASGVEAAVSEVAAQRRELLRGAALNLTPSAVVWQGTDPGGAAVSGVVRLMALGSDGAVLQPEAGKLDVNEASEELLKGGGALSSEVLSKVVAGRRGRAWGSVWEIVALGSEAGTGEAPVPASASAPVSADGAASEGGGALPGEEGAPETPAVEARDRARESDVLTCYSADPQARSGFGADGAIDPDATGRARRVLPEAWTEEFERAIGEDVGTDGAAWLGGLARGGRQPKSATALATSAAVEGVDPVAVAAMLDALEFDEGGTRRGLVDLLTAPAEVLAGVPGIPAALADRIVAAREKLESSRRATALWPVLEGLVELGEFAPALDFVTSRCLVFRVIVEGGVVGGELRGEASEWVLRDRWAFEAIIDASEFPVRIAYLRAATFDGLIVPGARAPDAPAREPSADAAPEQEPEPPPESDAAIEPAPEPEGAAPSEPEAPAAVDSPAAPSEGGSPGAAARSRIGRWSGGGGRGGSGSSTGGTPK